jgi:hypothetical protein
MNYFALITKQKLKLVLLSNFSMNSQVKQLCPDGLNCLPYLASLDGCFVSEDENRHIRNFEHPSADFISNRYELDNDEDEDELDDELQFIEQCIMEEESEEGSVGIKECIDFEQKSILSQIPQQTSIQAPISAPIQTPISLNHNSDHQCSVIIDCRYGLQCSNAKRVSDAISKKQSIDNKDYAHMKAFKHHCFHGDKCKFMNKVHRELFH